MNQHKKSVTEYQKKLPALYFLTKNCGFSSKISINEYTYILQV